MLRKIAILALVSALTALPLAAATAAETDPAGTMEPTFYKEVLPILQENCQTCHRPAGLNLGGMIAPMPLITYAETRPWAKSIARSVAAREMPPWDAAEHYNGVFDNERTLEQSEIDTLVAWATSGAGAGEPADAPAPLEWPATEWYIGEPDVVLTLAEPFHVDDDLRDLNINLPAQDIPLEILTEDRYVTAIEYKPATTAVHHIIGFAVLPGGDGSMNGGVQMLAGIAPGAEASQFPPGYGIKIPKGSKMMLQMHYHKEPGPGTEVWDQSSVAIKFADGPVKPMHVSSIGDPRKMYVPANTKDHFITTEQTFDRGITIMGLLPHMHYRGTYSKYVAKLPDGSESEFLEVPNYDFNWQTRYRFKEFLELPAGTTIAVTMGYDNTSGNPNNPDPNSDVKWGDSTDEEMNLGFMYWAFTDQEDETGHGTTPFRRTRSEASGP